ncbi:MAG: class I SAM-dependent methyltransferase [Desulfatibacillaceae bacterium]
MTKRYKAPLSVDINGMAARSGVDRVLLTKTVNRYNRIFRGIDLADKRVLEIGAGTGMLSCLMAVSGAREVVALEPEAAGSSSGALAAFERNLERFGVDNVELRPRTFQAADVEPGSVDVAVLIASVNHLDEDLTPALRDDEAARAEYVRLFARLVDMMAPGGVVVMYDVGRRNLFSTMADRFNVPNPLAPRIEWFKHQQPALWRDLMVRAGFPSAGVEWNWIIPCFAAAQDLPLRDSPLFNNAPGSWLTGSEFVLRARK